MPARERRLQPRRPTGVAAGIALPTLRRRDGRSPRSPRVSSVRGRRWWCSRPGWHRGNRSSRCRLRQLPVIRTATGTDTSGEMMDPSMSVHWSVIKPPVPVNNCCPGLGLVNSKTNTSGERGRRVGARAGLRRSHRQARPDDVLLLTGRRRRIHASDLQHAAAGEADQLLARRAFRRARRRLCPSGTGHDHRGRPHDAAGDGGLFQRFATVEASALDRLARVLAHDASTSRRRGVLGVSAAIHTSRTA